MFQLENVFILSVILADTFENYRHFKYLSDFGGMTDVKVEAWKWSYRTTQAFLF